MLPMVETDEDWDAVVPDEAVMRPGAVDLCARLGLAGAPLVRFAEGSQPVYAVGDDHVLKLFPGAAAADGLAEGRVLSYLEDRLPVPTPRVRAAGAYENGWRYVLMSRLRGQNLARVWDSVPAGARERLVAEIGEALAVLHALDPAPLADVLGPGDWGAFTDRQRAAAVARQRDRGLPDAWLEQIPDFLAAVPLPRVPPRPALLHTEVMRQHFMVEPDGWRLSGLFDFEPAMIGDPAYDFVGVGVFVTGADRSLMARLTDAYGHRVDPRTSMAYTLLHVCADLAWYLRLNPPRGSTLDDLAEEWFGTGGD